MSLMVRNLLAAALVLSGAGVVAAQTVPAPHTPKARVVAPAASQSAADQSRLRDSMKQCITDWDKGTHITRQRWNQICQEKFKAAEKAARVEQARIKAEQAKAAKTKSDANSAPKPKSQ